MPVSDACGAEDRIARLELPGYLLSLLFPAQPGRNQKKLAIGVDVPAVEVPGGRR